MFNSNSILFTSEMISLVSEIDEFKGVWRTLDGLAPERLSALRKVATIESVGSSTRIEGSKLSDEEVEKLLARLETKTFVSRDEQEVAGYARVMDTIFESFQAIGVTENYLKQLHRMLLEFSEKDIRHRGAYKTLSNSVEAFDAQGRSMGVVFETSTPFNTPREMSELIDWSRQMQETKALHPLLVVAVFIVVFLAIHPFQDGNGRLSRVITTLLLLKAGYGYVPYSSLESVIEQNKEGYYLALRRTQGTLKNDNPDWTPWLEFFLKSLQKQKHRLEKKIEEFKLMQMDLSVLALRVLDMAKQQRQVTIADIVRTTQAPHGTIKRTLRELVKAGHLKMYGRGRASWYSRS